MPTTEVLASLRGDPEQAESLVREYLRCCLTIMGDDPVLRSTVLYESGKALAVVLVPVPAPGKGETVLSQCEQDIISLLMKLSDPMPAEKIRDEMELKRIGTWGLRTVKRALARLKDELELIGNVRRKRKFRPRGYYLLAKQMELFRDNPHAQRQTQKAA
jgi:hypothetical protein